MLNAVLGREAIASVPAARAGMGSGANQTARYLGAACGITLFVTVATHAGDTIIDGWNTAVLVSAAPHPPGSGGDRRRPAGVRRAAARQPATVETIRTRSAGSSQTARDISTRPLDTARNGMAMSTASSHAGSRASPEKIRLVSVVLTASRDE